ncbi:MAG: Glu/Leu/Phe/Val dehydrogenase [Syntrophorhabdales bacterium]|jgi:glutamate dehydrogenase (NAD(P)+)
MTNVVEFEPDTFGPEKIVVVHDPRTRMLGYLVIDNTARGMGKGGVRMASDLTFNQVMRLARTMTWKNAAANLPLGGAKGGIVADPKDPAREAIIRSYAKALKNLIPKEYVFGLDMGLSEADAALVVDELGDPKASTGKPAFLGGIPYDKLMITGYGVVEAVKVACEFAGIDLSRSTLAIQGFGAVGKGIAKFASDTGALIVAVSDTSGALYDPKGLELSEILHIVQEGGKVTDYGRDCLIPLGDELFLPVDILLPCAKGDVVDEVAAARIQAKIIAEGANFATSTGAQKVLHKRGIWFVPDFIANAGGVISAYIELINGTSFEAFESTRERIRNNTKEMLEKASQGNMLPLEAAMDMARERVVEAMKAKGRWRES